MDEKLDKNNIPVAIEEDHSIYMEQNIQTNLS